MQVDFYFNPKGKVVTHMPAPFPFGGIQMGKWGSYTFLNSVTVDEPWRTSQRDWICWGWKRERVQSLVWSAILVAGTLGCGLN